MAVIFQGIASALIISYLVIVGYKKRWGWWVAILGNVVFLVASVLSQSWGFVPLPIVVIGLSLRNWYLWGHRND